MQELQYIVHGRIQSDNRVAGNAYKQPFVFILMISVDALLLR